MREFLFDEATHTYTLDGQKIPSVTEILAPITAGKYPPSGVVQQAAARGTRIHELCALYDMDALPEEFEGELVPYVQAWADFCRDWSPEWLYIELPLYAQDTESRYAAGTVDRIGVIDGAHIVVDIKTAQSMDRAAKIALCCQLYGYSWMADRNLIPIDGLGLGVQLMKDGTYRLQWQAEIQKKYGFASCELFWPMRRMHHIVKGY